MRTFLVTGGAGFIGSHIATALCQRGDRVRVLDNLSTGHLGNLDHIRDDVEFLEGDVQDPQAVHRAVQNVDCVFHQAALASVPRSVEYPLETNAVCVTGTLNVLHEARRAGVRRVVYAASSSAYGDRPEPWKSENDLPGPLSPYAAAKLAGEAYCSAFYQTYGLETVSLRYFNVFGPRQDPDSPYAAVIPIFITHLLQDTSPTIYGDGGQSRDFTYVDNVVHGNLLAADSDRVAGRILNVADGRSTTLLELLRHLNTLLGTDVQPTFAAPRPGDVRASQADITQARQLMDYQPQTNLEEGLRRSIEYYRAVFGD